MPNLELAHEGLTQGFLADLKSDIQSTILPAAESYFTEEGTAYTQNNASLKKVEMVVNYYDYQPCCSSVLGLLAAQGHDRALTVVRRLFENVGYYIGEGREKEGFKVSLRRSQLHLVLCREHLKPILETSETDVWGQLLAQSCEDMLAHFNGLQERVPALDNRGFGTGINHVAIAADLRTVTSLFHADILANATNPSLTTGTARIRYRKLADATRPNLSSLSSIGLF